MHMEFDAIRSKLENSVTRQDANNIRKVKNGNATTTATTKHVLRVCGGHVREIFLYS